MCACTRHSSFAYTVPVRGVCGRACMGGQQAKVYRARTPPALCIDFRFLFMFLRATGEELRKQGLNRIGNMVIPNANYCKFEDWMMPILDDMLKVRAVVSWVAWGYSRSGSARSPPAHGGPSLPPSPPLTELGLLALLNPSPPSAACMTPVCRSKTSRASTGRLPRSSRGEWACGLTD